VTDSANVELVRRVFEAFARRADDRAREEAVVNQWHEDARWYPLLLAGGALEGEVYEGHEGLRRFTRAQADDAWSNVDVEVLDVRELDADRVIAHCRLTAVGEASGVRLQTETWSLFKLREQKVLEGRVFADQAAALAYGAEPA
jgi:ketosteroid isomerase-like protein